jgi:hypothetical protein
VIISTILLIVTAVFFSTLGIFFSSFLKRTLAATISSYGSILLSVLMLVFFVFSMGFLTSLTYGTGNTLNEDVLMIFVWIVISTNPLLAPIFTEMILIEDQSIFISSSNSFIGTGNMHLLSPWIIYVLTYSVLTVIMILVSIWFVKRPER